MKAAFNILHETALCALKSYLLHHLPEALEIFGDLETIPCMPRFLRNLMCTSNVYEEEPLSSERPGCWKHFK